VGVSAGNLIVSNKSIQTVGWEIINPLNILFSKSSVISLDIAPTRTSKINSNLLFLVRAPQTISNLKLGQSINNFIDLDLALLRPTSPVTFKGRTFETCKDLIIYVEEVTGRPVRDA